MGCRKGNSQFDREVVFLCLVGDLPSSIMIMKIHRSLPVAGFASAVFLLGLSQASAKVSVSKLFGDHMVLQQEAPIRLWGAAEPGDCLLYTSDAADE